MTCANCDGPLDAIKLKGYRIHIDTGRILGPEVVTTSCMQCGLIHLHDPRRSSTKEAADT